MGRSSSLLLWCSLISSHHLCQEAAHGLCGFVLLLAGGVGAGAECESGIVVAQHALFADLSCNEKVPWFKI